MKPILLKNKQRLRRKRSVRRNIRMTATRPRLSVFRSSKHISVQLIDDKTGRTLAAASTTSGKFSSDMEGKDKTGRAAFIGAEIARRAKEAGVEEVVFDRGRFKYHGRVKALAEAAREGGLRF